MKNVYIVGGTMGVGKTTVCQLLKRRLDKAVFLDGDWCWDSDPFQVTPETKTMVMDNICYLLNNFIHCSAYENIIFCWVMHEQSIIDAIHSRLDVGNCNVKTMSLICSAEALTERLKKDIAAKIRHPDIIKRSIDRIPFYAELKTIKIDTSDIPAEQVAKVIASL